MIALHLLILVLLPTAGADPALLFVGRALLAVAEGADAEHARVVVPDRLFQDVLIDATLLSHIFIRHQCGNLLLQRFGVVGVLVVSVVIDPPGKPLHLLAIGGEEQLDPFDDTSEIIPKVLGIRIQLVLHHALLDALFGVLSVTIPIDHGLKVVLAVSSSLEVVVPKPVSGTARLAEVALRIWRSPHRGRCR